MSSNPFEAPPRETATTLPPNRVTSKSPRRTLAVWLVLCVLFVALYQVVGDPASAPKTPREAIPTLFAGIGPVAWLLPALTYGAMIVALFTFRARLPASHRTGELRTQPITRPEPPAPDPSPRAIELHLTGTDGSRPVHLDVDDAGLHWRADARLLQVAVELHVPWGELESVSVTRAPTGLTVWAWVAIIFGVSSLFLGNYLTTAVCAALAAALFTVARKRSIGVFSFATPTHVLTFQSRQLDAATSSELLAAVRARRPSAAPAPDQKQSGVAKVLLIDPFVQLADAFGSDARLDAKIVHGSADAALRVISRLQTRMFSVWSGTMRGAGPLAVAGALVLSRGDPWAFVLGWMPAWILGLVLVQSLLVPFARFAGMTVLR
ncbi:hypothetical protein L6R52_04935 [Myxococcota bacterium]|nr:hypothetical protein [Myxococcota bacterium]